MKKAFAVSLVLVLLASALAGALKVRALSTTIVVPDDYPTITAAIDNAMDGDTILIKSGTYQGPINQTIVIDKTLTIMGENADNTVIELYPAYSVSTILWYAYYDYSDAMYIAAEDFRLVNLNIVVPR